LTVYHKRTGKTTAQALFSGKSLSLGDDGGLFRDLPARIIVVA